MFVDIHLEGLLGLIPDKPKERIPRRLKSGNQKTTKECIKNLKDKLVNQNAFTRVSSLWEAVETGIISSVQKEEYEKLDDTITACMQASEKKLNPPDNAARSEERINMQSKIRYYKLLFQRSQGSPVNEEVLQRLRVKLNLKNNSNDPKELNALINCTWTKWKTYKEQEHVHQELQIEHMIQDADKADDNKRARAIRKIKHVEKTRRMHRRISQALGSKRGNSLAKIEVPIELEGRTVGWKTLCGTDKVRQAIIEIKIKHLDQASETPFGSREGYDHL